MEKRQKQRDRVRETQHKSRRQARRKRKLRKIIAAHFNRTTWDRDYNKAMYRRFFSYTRSAYDE